MIGEALLAVMLSYMALFATEQNTVCDLKSGYLVKWQHMGCACLPVS